MKLILIIIFIVLAYVCVFALAKAQSNLHRMEERWAKEKELEIEK